MVSLTAQSQPSPWAKGEERDVVYQRHLKRFNQGPADPWAYSPPPAKTTLYNSAADVQYPSMGARYDRFSKRDAGSWALHPTPSKVPPPGSYETASSFHRKATPTTARLPSPRSVSPRSNAPLTKKLNLMAPASARAAAPASIVRSQYYMHTRTEEKRFTETRKIDAGAKEPDRPRQETINSFMSIDKGSNIVHYIKPPYAPHVQLSLSRGARSGMDTISRRRTGPYVAPIVSRIGTPVLSQVAGRGVH
jgi:hypothetical protein